MYNVAFRIVKDTAEAEDVMQESFITAFSKLDSFKGKAAFGAWLKRIVVNNSIVQYRKSQRFVQVSEEHIADEAESCHDGIAEDISHLQSQKLMECIGSLHENYQNIISLHFIEGYDYEEICEIMQISYSNCRTMVSRAKESLRKKITLV